MNRRNALVALFSVPLGAFAFHRAEAGSSVLTIPLDQWSGIVVQHGGKSVTLSSAEIFDALGTK